MLINKITTCIYWCIPSSVYITAVAAYLGVFGIRKAKLLASITVVLDPRGEFAQARNKLISSCSNLKEVSTIRNRLAVCGVSYGLKC